MYYQVESALNSFWQHWTAIFAPLPYGDPFVASAALVALLVFGIKVAVGGDPAAR